MEKPQISNLIIWVRIPIEVLFINMEANEYIYINKNQKIYYWNETSNNLVVGFILIF